MTRARGFTLIELVACIVIIGILAAAAGPSFLDNRSFNERGYIDEVAAALRHAQRVAVASGCEVSVTINAAGYQAMQRSAAGGTCSAAGAWTLPARRGDGTALSGTSPADVTLTPVPVQIVFDSRGWVSNAAAPVLSVGTFTLTVQATSGLVAVQ